MTESMDTVEHTTSFKKLLSIYLKTSKKRVLVTIGIGAIIFIALTSFFMIWYSNRYNTFYSYIDENHDWKNDGLSSINSQYYTFTSLSLDADYLSKGIGEVTTALEAIMPGIQRSVTGALRIGLYNNIVDWVYDEHYVHTLDENVTSLVTNNLVAGRMPENFTELLYYRVGTESLYNISDIVSLSGWSNTEAVEYNNRSYTIVGIVSNLESKLYAAGYSADVLKKPVYYYYEEGPKSQFITTNDLFYDLVNTVQNFSSSFKADIDIDYQFTISHIKNKNKYLKAFQDYWQTYPEFTHMPGYWVSFCEDLITAFGDFERSWQTTTVSLIAASVPIVFLFGLISIETFNIGNHEQESKYRLIKTQGLENKVLARMVFIENIITISSSFLIGTFLGLFVGYFVFLGLDRPEEVTYFTAFSQAIIPVTLIVVYLLFVLIKFIFDLIQTRRASLTTSSQYKKKRRTILRKIFSIPEVIAFLPGALLTTVGLIFVNAFSYIDYTFSSNIFQLMFLFYFMAAFGLLLLLISVFMLLTRLITLIWKGIGNASWKNRKSFFTLALKHLSIYRKNYQRTMMAIFVLGLGVIPGLIMTKSVSLHANIEARLTTGCSDIAIEDWTLGSNLRTNVTSITGVEYTAELNIITMIYSISSGWDYTEYKTRFHSIQNISEYQNTVNLTSLEADGITSDDISQLNTDLTYLMSRKYAKKNDHDKGVIFKTTGITPDTELPLELTYVNDFSYYPLLTRHNYKTEQDVFFNNFFITKIDLVVSKTTAELVTNTSINTKEEKNYLLLKIDSASNITRIKEELIDLGLKPIIKQEVEQEIHNRINDFANVFLIVGSITTILAIILFGGVNAIGVYKQRLRIIEPEVQIGARRKMIWSNFTIELVFIIIIPLIISIGIAVPLINNFSSFVLNVTQIYKKFTPWQPWWILVIVALMGVTALLTGWFSRIIPLVKSYRPIKQE